MEVEMQGKDRRCCVDRSTVALEDPEVIEVDDGEILASAVLEADVVLELVGNLGDVHGYGLGNKSNSEVVVPVRENLRHSRCRHL